MVKYSFVGYGSLVSHKSFRPKSHARIIKPVIVKGYKRIFNIAESKGNKSDILNIVKSKLSKFNGVLFKVDEFGLKKLRERENWYNFEETQCFDFETGKKMGKCLICVDHYFFIDKRKKLPKKSYFVLCREAAYQISKKFGKFWDETTFTASGEKISSWIKKHEEYDTIGKNNKILSLTSSAD